jgi:hypothetical protein
VKAVIAQVSAQANLNGRKSGQVKRSGRSQNRMHTQNALMQFLLLGKVDSRPLATYRVDGGPNRRRSRYEFKTAFCTVISWLPVGMGSIRQRRR